MTFDLSSCPTLEVFVQAYLRQFPDCKLFDMDHETLEKITAEVGKVIENREFLRQRFGQIVHWTRELNCTCATITGTIQCPVCRIRKLAETLQGESEAPHE